MSLACSSVESLYAVLGLRYGASASEVKSAYRKLVLHLHPDKHPGDKTKEELFSLITLAYQTLSDPERLARFQQDSSVSSSSVVEVEQHRAADSVFHVVLHNLFAPRTDAMHAFASQYLWSSDVNHRGEDDSSACTDSGSGDGNSNGKQPIPVVDLIRSKAGLIPHILLREWKAGVLAGWAAIRSDRNVMWFVLCTGLLTVLRWCFAWHR